MKSEKGLGLLQLILVSIVLLILLFVAGYAVIGPNGVLNREVVEPINNTNEIEENNN